MCQPVLIMACRCLEVCRDFFCDMTTPDFYHIALKLFLIKKDQLLILEGATPKFIDIPGGRIGQGEFKTPLSAILRREVKEEIGNVKYLLNIQPLIFWRYEVPSGKHKGRRIFYLGYEGKYLSGIIKLSKEHTAYRWVDLKSFTPKLEFKCGFIQAVEDFLTYRRGAPNYSLKINH